MASKLVRVELGDHGNVIRIFRDKSWLTCLNPVQLMDRAKAVRSIRMQVYDRAMVDNFRNTSGTCYHECERCGRSITWDTFEMHETVHRGKGGEQSLENCEALCRSCHQTGPDAAHKDRKWQTAKLSPEGQNGNY